MTPPTRTLDELNDIEAIKAVKYAYLRCLDTKNWDELATLLCEDATAAYSGGKYTYTGRDEIVGFVSKNMGREEFHSSHRAHHPEIRLDGDRAEATWALEDIVIDSEWNFLLIGAAFYEDVYVRVGGRWMIQHTGYRRSFCDHRQLVGDRRTELTAGHVTGRQRAVRARI
jgi:hypothetical protein